MKSYTVGRNYYGTLTKKTDATNLSFGDQVANDDYKALCAIADWPFLTRQRTLTTVASTQFYNLPYDCDQVRSISVQISNLKHTPRMSPDQRHWDELNVVTFTSDIPQWWFTLNGQLGIWPKPASAGNTITVTQKTRVIDLSAADYSTGTITTVATASTITTVTGSGVSWGAGMVGRFINIAPGSAANAGDGEWYEIASVPSSTTLTLVRTYGGTAITAGAATYTIGQMPLLPESFHDMPWLYAAGMYWGKESDKRSDLYLGTHGNMAQGNSPATGKVKLLLDSWLSPNASMVIDDGGGNDILNPNLTITL